MSTLDLTGYHLTFDDEFNSFLPTELGGPTWDVTIFNGNNTYGSENYTSGADGGLIAYLNGGGVNPFSDANGVLSITATPNTPGATSDYTTGLIENGGEFGQTYGYFEMRAELPAGAGFWPGFWMLPSVDNNMGTPEIDAMEAFGAPYGGYGGSNKVHYNVHSGTNPNETGAWATVNANIYTTYNTYGVLWTPTDLTFYFDGQSIGELPTPTDLVGNPGEYLIASLLTGAPGDWPGPMDGETGSMKIDYIRAFSSDAAVPEVALQQISSPDGGGTDLYGAVTLACFAQGTRIATARGEVHVEALAVGDMVRTVGGRRDGLSRIVWIGSRRVDCRRHPRPAEICPVRVRAGAFGGGLPRRDLLLSPEHAVFIDGVLIPVRYLINDATIVQETPRRICYWHIELEQHDVVLAEGLPCESFLDTGNRSAFANGGPAVALHPDFAIRAWETSGCAPLVLDGAELVAARSYLLECAEMLDFSLTSEPSLYLVAGRHKVLPQIDGNRYRFHIPQSSSRDLKLISRHAIPARVFDESPDNRRIGVAVSKISVNGSPMALTDARLRTGWHDAESGWRWTDGCACLHVEEARDLELDLAMTARYWRATPTATMREIGTRA